jgi:hypothetical protein
MNSEALKKKLSSLRERRARIDAAIEQFEAQFDAQERTGQKDGEVLEVEPARGGGSYVLQKVKCGKPSCRCARPSVELHGPYRYLFTGVGGKARSKYVGKERGAGAPMLVKEALRCGV